MSILLLWTALSAVCATNAPPIYDDEIKDAITMIATELKARHHEIRCWEPINESAGWLTKYEGGTTALANEVIRIAKLGSTVLVESIGGQHTFASTMQLQIEKITANTFTYDERFHHFNTQRGWSILNRKHIEPPLITTINDGAIIIVDCDIRNALLDKSAWGVHGYGPVHAVQLIETLLDE